MKDQMIRVNAPVKTFDQMYIESLGMIEAFKEIKEIIAAKMQNLDEFIEAFESMES